MTFLKRIFLALAICFATDGLHAQTEVTFYTSMGDFKVLLTDNLTPITVDSFLARVSDKFYDGTIFHRVIDNFVIQGGDPTGTGTGGPGYTFQDEFHPTLKNVPGALAMANSGSNTNGSQFYVNLVNNAHLNNIHTVFGMVTTGFSIVQDIGHVATDASNRPLTDVVLDSIRITATPTSITGVARNETTLIYPNPCSGQFYLQVEQPSLVEVFQMNGTAVYSSLCNEYLAIDMKQYPAGAYLVQITNQHRIQKQLLIKY